MLVEQHRLTYFQRIRRGIYSLLSGMGLTFKYFRKPSTVVTQQYPENRLVLKMFERFRGKVVLPHNDNNEHKCTGCGLCEPACPNGTITILTQKNEETNKKELDRFIYRYETCIICNLCIEVCPFDAIEMSREFETAVFDRRDLIEQLNLPGSTLEEKQEETKPATSDKKPAEPKQETE